MLTSRQIATTMRQALTKQKEAERQRLVAENQIANEEKHKADIMMREAQAKQAEAVQMASQNAGL